MIDLASVPWATERAGFCVRREDSIINQEAAPYIKFGTVYNLSLSPRREAGLFVSKTEDGPKAQGFEMPGFSESILTGSEQDLDGTLILENVSRSLFKRDSCF